MDRTATAEPEEDKEEAAAIREVVSIAGVRLAERAVPVECYACPEEAMAGGALSVDATPLEPGELCVCALDSTGSDAPATGEQCAPQLCDQLTN